MLTRQKFPFIPPETTWHLKIPHGSLIKHPSQWKISVHFLLNSPWNLIQVHQSFSPVENFTFCFSYTVAKNHPTICLNFPKKLLTLKGPNESSSNKCSRKPTRIDALNTEGKLSKNSLYF